MERQLIERVLQETQGNKSRAAASAGPDAEAALWAHRAVPARPSLTFIHNDAAPLPSRGQRPQRYGNHPGGRNSWHDINLGGRAARRAGAGRALRRGAARDPRPSAGGDGLASAWESVASAFRRKFSCRHMLDEVRAELKDWRAAIDGHADYDELILWYGHDLFDQLNLIQVLSRIARTVPATKPVDLICIGTFPGRPAFIGSRRADATRARPASRDAAPPWRIALRARRASLAGVSCRRSATA